MSASTKWMRSNKHLREEIRKRRKENDEKNYKRQQQQGVTSHTINKMYYNERTCFYHF